MPTDLHVYLRPEDVKKLLSHNPHHVRITSKVVNPTTGNNLAVMQVHATALDKDQNILAEVDGCPRPCIPPQLAVSN